MKYIKENVNGQPYEGYGPEYKGHGIVNSTFRIDKYSVNVKIGETDVSIESSWHTVYATGPKDAIEQVKQGEGIGEQRILEIRGGDAAYTKGYNDGRKGPRGEYRNPWDDRFRPREFMQYHNGYNEGANDYRGVIETGKVKYRIQLDDGRIKFAGTGRDSWFTLEGARETVRRDLCERIVEHDGVNVLWEVF